MSVSEIARRANISRSALNRNLYGPVRYASPVFMSRLLAVLPYPSMFEAVDVETERTSVSA